ncbi:tetratricopeptide repeat protein [Aquisphaera insulae]|uniref:tetratricopeptide repeat protein n=1 Tax=Aquisphaera insulae TaxID=2712864 RepID=UPI0013ED9112|nr:tetratricopeptide repeat protein [Aquisphaera insulae]
MKTMTGIRELPRRAALALRLAAMAGLCGLALIACWAMSRSGAFCSSPATERPRLETCERARQLLGDRRTDEAIQLLEESLQRGEDAGLLELLGLAIEREGDLDGAERAWRRALAAEPDHPETLLDLGRLYLGQHRLDEAAEILEHAVRRSPTSIDSVYSLARAYRLRGDLSKAVPLEARAAELRLKEPPRGGMGEMPRADPAANR